jgi:uncharacterized surface protein with fasciclin (FAS1) repeats
LKAKGPFTVVAPTNAAFALLPKGMLKSLLLIPDDHWLDDHWLRR